MRPALQRAVAQVRHQYWRRRPGEAVERPPASLEVRDEGRAAGPCVAIYCAYAPTGRLRDYHREALRRLSDLACTVLVVNQDAEGSQDLGTTAPSLVVRRPNRGFDFGAWGAGLRAYLSTHSALPERLVLLNDSVFGPLRDGGAWLPAVQGSVDVWGPTLAPLPRPHLQSWLLVLEERALRAGLSDWLTDAPDLRSKAAVVARREVGLSAAMTRCGLQGRPLVAAPPHPHDGVAYNPSHHDWERLLDHGLSFVKRELLFDDPHGIGAAARVAAVLEAHGLDGATLLGDLAAGRRR